MIGDKEISSQGVWKISSEKKAKLCNFVNLSMHPKCSESHQEGDTRDTWWILLRGLWTFRIWERGQDVLGHRCHGMEEVIIGKASIVASIFFNRLVGIKFLNSLLILLYYKLLKLVTRHDTTWNKQVKGWGLIMSYLGWHN